MTDRLEELLRDGPPGEVDATGLAAGARTRRRTRRQSRGAIAVAVAAVAAVPLAMTFADDPQRAVEPAPPAATSADPDSSLAPMPSDERVESWRDLTALVPDTWGYGGGTDWCASDGSGAGPEVVRTGGAVRSIGCTPQQGYGLYFGDGSAINWVYDSGHVWQYGWESADQVKVYPEDAWLGFFQHGENYVMVVTPDEATTREVLASVRVVEDRDPHGCTPRDGDNAALGDGDHLSVCRYGSDGWLEESLLLSEDDSEAFREAVAAAPFKEDADSCIPRGDEEEPGQVRIGAGGDLGGVSVVFESWCPAENGVYLSGVSRDLTEDVMRFVLMPGWSGGLVGSVPVPQEAGGDR